MMEQQPLFAGQLGPQGLYDPRHEHDACGVGFVVNIKGKKSHGIVEQALSVLINLLHRGACGCEPNTGDGAGILLQMPDRFLRRECARLGLTLPPAGQYGSGLVFLPRDLIQRDKVRALIGTIVAEEGQRLLGWREVPVDDHPLGTTTNRVPRTPLRQPWLGSRAGIRRARDGPNPARRKLRAEQMIRQSIVTSQSLRVGVSRRAGIFGPRPPEGGTPTQNRPR